MTVESMRRWRERNPGESARRSRQWREDHPGYNSDAGSRYRERHPDRVQQTSALSRSRRKHKMSWYMEKRRFGYGPTLEEWEAIWNGPCFGCGKTPASGVDHIIPKSNGGENVIPNLQPACFPCNQKKGRK